jgi:hypothetical protein
MEVSAQLHAPAALLPQKNPSTHWVGGNVDQVESNVNYFKQPIFYYETCLPLRKLV